MKEVHTGWKEKDERKERERREKGERGREKVDFKM